MPKRGHKKDKRVIGDLSDPRGMAVMSARYLEWLGVANYSQRTVENREVYLGYFIEWCEERGISRPADVTKPILDRYQRWLYQYRKENGQPLSFRGQHSRLVPVRAFFKWLAKNNHLLYNPASELELPRLEQRLPKHVLTASEAEQVINQADSGDELGVRDRAILETFYSTGMRRMELIGLKRYDLDVERGTVMVRQGKGKKDRMIPIGDRAVAWIEKYLTEVRPSLAVEPDDGTLFLTNLGEAFTPNRLTQLVRQYVKAAELGKTGACHLFRHTMATLMLENGADIRFIQEMLGHADVSTTQIYTQVSIRKLKEIHTATHPAKLRRGDTETRGRGDAETGAEERGRRGAEEIRQSELRNPQSEMLFSLAARAALLQDHTDSDVPTNNGADELFSLAADPSLHEHNEDHQPTAEELFSSLAAEAAEEDDSEVESLP
jgi:integrase/recombinase XerD